MRKLNLHRIEWILWIWMSPFYKNLTSALSEFFEFGRDSLRIHWIWMIPFLFNMPTLTCVFVSPIFIKWCLNFLDLDESTYSDLLTYTQQFNTGTNPMTLTGSKKSWTCSSLEHFKQDVFENTRIFSLCHNVFQVCYNPFNSIGNIVGNAGLQHFLLYPQWFQRPST